MDLGLPLRSPPTQIQKENYFLAFGRERKLTQHPLTGNHLRWAAATAAQHVSPLPAPVRAPLSIPAPPDQFAAMI